MTGGNPAHPRTMEFDNEAFMSDLERAVKTNDGIEHLNKSEAVYYLSAALTGEVPDGHPSDHNGNVTRQQVMSWAAQVGAAKREGNEFDYDVQAEADDNGEDE